MADNLSKFGNVFQSKVIAALLSDRLFLERILDIVSKDFFESDANKWILEKIIEHYLQYKNPPSMVVFKVEVDKIDIDILKAAVIEQLKNVYTKLSDEDLTFVKDQFIEFCKNQKLKSAITDSIDLLKQGEYEKIKHIVDEALKAGMEKHVGHDYINDFDLRYSESARSCIKTNWPLIDELMDGGLGKGELGVVVGSAGGGKCVGSNTEIEIKYHEIGLEFTGNFGKSILWISPFEKYKLDDKELYGWQVENVIWELNKLTELQEEENLHKK